MGDPSFDAYKQMAREVALWREREGREAPYVDIVAAAPELFHLLCELCLDNAVAAPDRARLLGAIIYFAAPIDLVPERLIGAAGYVDDAILAAYVIQGVADHVGADIVAAHWSGEGDIMALVVDIQSRAETILGRDVWQRVRDKADSW
jgi:uncharacterized membrane protein YkvA (DUF1232 family)